jgi:DNA-binding transcriptional LysR family regulator
MFMVSPPSGLEENALEGISLERLRSFLSVVEAGGFTRAARGDPTRQSQLSRQVKELEAALGQSLLERSRTGVVATETGVRLATLSRELLQGLRQLKGAALPWKIGAGDSLLRWLVLPALGELQGEPTKATFSVKALDTPRIVEALREGKLDLGVVREQAPQGLRSRKIGKIEYALFVPQPLVRRYHVESAEDVLDRVPLALQRSEEELTDPLLERTGGRMDLACETFPQACTAVQCGGHGALLPTLAEIDLPARRVKRFDVSWLPSRALHLVWDQRRIEAREGGPGLLERMVRATSQGFP